MKDQLIKFETAKLAKEKGFLCDLADCQWSYLNENGMSMQYDEKSCVLRPTQSLLQRFIREQRGVHIEIHRNGSGYYWSMCIEDGGTDLGWSDHKGPDLGGVWEKFEDALEDALVVQLSYDLPDNIKVIKHWGNYVEFAIKSLK